MLKEVRVSYDNKREQWIVERRRGKRCEARVFDTTRIVDENGDVDENGFAYVSDELICDLVEAQERGFKIKLTI